MKNEILTASHQIVKIIRKFESKTNLLVRRINIIRGLEDEVQKISFDLFSTDGFGKSLKSGNERMPNGVFAELFKETQEMIHEDAVKNQWWDKIRSDRELISMIHSDISEALETLESLGDRNIASKKIEGFTHTEEKLADAVIRIMDYAEARGLDVGGAIEMKIIYNKTHQQKAGGERGS